ncbi:hypothetical protein EJ05DRAFT_496433 [Pseudovirgaria hyperparasitica]|uniref:Uncharacterized protein n=1 Tax=Pseudovirgaria hyperparasitica TaxID=470096 RepID=A0A6A6WFC5_9PEZI|nr:uncharacterized protein EJ05DRAFT_496433 [Pseudovirgaria hyperparasitica]KAF2761522.1 hypothetical protein EJ05DRAFT_496433 [Pseudovirgaria hyperparasitica]
MPTSHRVDSTLLSLVLSSYSHHSSGQKLCATATAIGASAVGLSIGRPLSTPASAALPNERPTNEQSNMLMTPPHCSNTRSPPFTSLQSSTLETGSHERRPVRMARRMTTSNTKPEIRLSTGRTQMQMPVEDDHFSDVHAELTLRTRPSWIKRLSNYSLQASSHECDSRPVSPSVSYSNASMAFSNAGSTVPMVGQPSPEPLAPNKLVKRSTSIRTFNNTARPTSSRMPTLRRPATSHQRSATLQCQTSLVGSTLDEDMDIRSPGTPSSSEVQYTRFFSPTLKKGRTASSKKKKNGDYMKPIKRIVPDARSEPTLLLAKSVVACSVEIDDLSSQDGDSIDLSRPGTPSFTHIQDQPRDRGLSVSIPIKRQEESSNGTKFRRSFSISDYLPAGPHSRKLRTEKQANNILLRSTSKRTTSAPLLRSQAAAPGGEHLSDQEYIRRDISDPTISHRIIGSSHAGSPVVDRTHESSPNSLARGGISTEGTRKSDSAPRHPRLSTAASEQASTLVGSDHDTRDIGSGDEDFDFQSDTVFDSLRTRGTRSTSGARGPRIETIFPDFSPTNHKANMQSMREIVMKDNGQPVPVETFPHAGIMEEDECTSSPGRTTTATERFDASPPKSQSSGNSLFNSNISASATDHPKPLSLGTLEWDAVAEEESDDDRWSFSDEEIDAPKHRRTFLKTPFAPSKQPSTPCTSSESSNFPALRQNHIEHIDRDARSSIFDWSEQRPSEKSPGSRTPPRPSTVHGKKDADGRGSRAIGRRAPSGLHARSQSVPVVPDLVGKRDTVVTNKFGTWGVGSKGVTEDWNDDFDFDGSNEPRTVGEDDMARADSGFSMFVPKTIREQQSNVLANIGLLREWGLLIEELKELRMRAVHAGLLDDRNKNTWHEVDAMIELADQEADDDPFGGDQSPTSSPGLDLDEFDDMNGMKYAVRTPQKVSASKDDTHLNSPGLSLSQGKSRRRSILRANNDLFNPNQTPPTSKLSQSHTSSPAMTPPAVRTTRPRKDSEAVALSVIEALKRKSTSDSTSTTSQPLPPAKKVPFDTATLKHIVPYVNGLMRRVKEELREAEGLYTSPNHSPKRKEPPHLEHMMDSSTRTFSTSPTERRAKSGDSHFQSNESELAAQMAMTTMTVM